MVELRRARLAALMALAFVLAAVAAGCGASPGGDEGGEGNEQAAQQAREDSKKIDVSKAGDVTLTVWDQEVRGGQAAQIKRLNRAFEQKYPNVTIKRVARSFDDLQTTLKLAVSGPDAPCVVQANQGRGVMGQLVKGGLLLPLDAYADAYGWRDRYSKVLLDLNSFSDDGQDFGSGSLYGLSQMGEIVGVYYNKDKVDQLPKTFEEFEQQLAEAKQAGEIPIAFGNLDQWPGIHEYQTVQGQFVPKDQIRDFVFARGNASFTSPENQDAAARIQQWAEQGYFTPDFNGTGYDPAWQQFTKGKGRFLIAGTWLTADLADAMGDKVGFMLMPPMEEGEGHVSLGGEGLPFAITEKCEHPDVAAAYIDHLTNAQAAEVLVETNNLPAMETDAAPAGGLSAEVTEAWKTLNEEDGIVPYLDYATPTFYDDISGAIQRLLAGRVAPEEFTQNVQQDYEKFTESQKLQKKDTTNCTILTRSQPPALEGERSPGEPRYVAYLYLLPGLAVFVAFVLLPLIHSGWISLFDWDGITAGEWVALENYEAVLTDPELRAPFVHALVLLVFYAVFPVIIGLLLAAVMSRAPVRGLAAFRTILFLPQVIALVVVAVIWRMIYAPEGGLINGALGAVGLDALEQNWLGDFDLALPAVGLIGTWVMYGLAMVLFTAGVQKIPQSLYDAARVDGAGPVREFFAVTLPGLRAEIAVALTLTTIAALRNFDLIYITTGGGPGDSTTVPAYEVYERAFLAGDVGGASAVGVCLAALIFALSFAINRFAERGAR